MEKTFQLAVGVCCCLQTYNSDVNMLVMGLVLGLSFMVISITDILLYAKGLPFITYYGSALLLFTCKLQHFDRSLHIGSLDPTCVQNFRPILPTVFDILGFKLKNKNNKRIAETNFLSY